MMKHIFITLLFMTVSFSSLAVKRAKASEFDKTFITHEQFVMMSAENRREVVVKFMEYMASAEGQSKFQEVVQNGTPQEKAKWMRVVQLFTDFLIPSAQAQSQSQSPFTKFNSNYLKVINDKKVGTDKRCIYGGWISSTQLTDTTCTHPSNILDKKGANAVSYVEQCPSAPNQPPQITCNPVVFGFDTGKKPLCASAYPAAHNSSLECMQKALSQGNWQKRLDDIAENLSNNPEVFHTVMEFIFYSCACDPKEAGSKSILNDKYHEYMRPHRTCYGLLNQMKNVLSRVKCEPLTTDENFQTFLGFLNKIQTKVGSYDLAANAKEISSNKAVAAKKKDTFDEQYGIAINEAYKNDSKTAAFCKAYSSTETPKTEPTNPPVTTGGGETKDEGVKTCTIECTLKDPPSPAGGDKKDKKDASPGDKDKKGPPPAGDQGKNDVPAAGAAVVGPQPEVDTRPVYACTKMRTGTGKDGVAQLLEQFEVRSKDEIMPDQLKDGLLDCTVDFPEESSGDQGDKKDDDALKVKLTPKVEADKVTLTITIKDKEDKDATDVKISWYNEQDKSKPLGDKPSIEQPRGTTKYSVCADITPPEGKTVDNKKLCGEVPAKEVTQPSPNPSGQQMPGQQRPQRQQNIHINYGIR